MTIISGRFATYADELRAAEIERQRYANARVLGQLAELNKLVRDHHADFVGASIHLHLSVSTIRRRWRLNDLCERAKLALHQGEISVAQAEVLAHVDAWSQYAALDKIAGPMAIAARTRSAASYVTRRCRRLRELS